MRFYLFSTSDFGSGRSEHLKRMIASVDAFVQAHPQSPVKLYLLMQNCDAAAAEEARATLPGWVEALAIDGRVSLSAARNRLIAHSGLTKTSRPGDSICAFPDDDCWYPADFMAMLKKQFVQDPQLGFWFCRYSSSPEAAGNVAPVAPSLQQVIARASSNTIFLRGETFCALAPFDEDLGVGAKLNGGEDTEYAIRAYYAAKKVLFVDRPLVGHRDPDPALRPKYFPGTSRAIGRHWLKSPAGAVAFIRKMLVGAWLVATGRMELSRFVSAFRGALG